MYWEMDLTLARPEASLGSKLSADNSSMIYSKIAMDCTEEHDHDISLQMPLLQVRRQPFEMFCTILGPFYKDNMQISEPQ